MKWRSTIYSLSVHMNSRQAETRAYLKNHSCNLHAPICGIFCLHSVDVARYAALIQAKSPTNCNAHLTESIFQTRSRACLKT
ncbi:DUF6783 domain-containing protein [Anaerobutyricum hallii]|uniref:DUF6783 domain-containing protein n=1 Tax=Anaerobutyricum hallii TaxID=39488 RepID=UPI003996B11F